MLIITIDTYISIIYQKSERKRSRMKGMAWSPLGMMLAGAVARAGDKVDDLQNL